MPNQKDQTGGRATKSVNKPTETADGAPVHLSEAGFDEFISNHKLCVIDFWAEWCAPCRFLEPIVEELAREYAGKAAFGKLNVDDNPRIAERYEIMSIPTLLVFKDGQPVHTIVGAMPKGALIEQLRPFLG
jgi:thioredoxin 1